MSSETITRNDLTNILNEIVAIDGTDMTEQEIEDFVDSLNISKINKTVEIKELLWTNSSPSSDFAGQTITVGAGYDWIEVETTEGMVRKGSSSIGHIRYGWSDGAVALARSMTYDKTAGTLWCDNGVICGLANITSFSINNSVCKPWKVYGIKIISL